MLIGNAGAHPLLADGSRASVGNQKRSIAENVTAHAGSSQGDGPITTDIVQISTCGVAGDAVTLPPIVPGMLITIENNGANSADVFPATGGNINGGGVNLAEALPAGEFVTYYAFDGVNWSTLSMTGGGGGVTDHGALTGLSDDDHSIYALLAGRSGGQVLIGGVASGENLTLLSTAHATKGLINFGSYVLDGVAKKWLGIEFGDFRFQLRDNSSLDAFEFTNDAGERLMNLRTDGRAFFGIGTGISAAVAFYQPSTTGIPVLGLSQLDINNAFINFIGTTAADGSRSISSDVTEDSAKFGAYRIMINGTTKWVRVYNDHS
ncbi:hypothetical protein LCGC14_0401540 [marine sediment metagenome]|uniref:Uncharacterized protein n=1 Tax=marine sediment metagenome TaxID=412755 RepID=A0A0F9VIL4_9ZZZZ